MIKDIIRKYNDFDSTHTRQLTNHLNMGLYALWAMGADEDKLESFAKDYTQEREMATIDIESDLINDDNFEFYLGKKGTYRDYVAFYRKQMQDRDGALVFRKSLNRLEKGFAGAAFHGIIRAAYAYELQDEDEMGKSLAYLSEAYLAFDMKFESLEVKEPIETILEFSKDNHFKSKKFETRLISDKMIEVYEDSNFKPFKLNSKFLTTPKMYELVLDLYGLTRDFTILHGFTSTHALSVLEPIIENYEEVLQRHWYNLQTAYLSTQCTPILSMPEIKKSIDWQCIFDKSQTSEDVHVIKLSYSLHQMSQKYGLEEKAYTLAYEK